MNLNYKITIIPTMFLLLGASVARVYCYLNPKVEIKEVPVEKIVEKEVVKEVKTYVLPEPLNTETKDWKEYRSKYGFYFRYPEKDVLYKTFIKENDELVEKYEGEPRNVGVRTYEKNENSYEFPSFRIYIDFIPQPGLQEFIEDNYESASDLGKSNIAYRITEKLSSSYNGNTHIYTYAHKDAYYTIKEIYFEKNNLMYHVQYTLDDKLINKVFTTLIFE